MIIDSVRAFAERYDMLPTGSRVLCALSGGADSVCLLSILTKIPDIDLAAAHYNHCLRGEEAERDEAFVRSLCEKMDIPCFFGRGDVAAHASENGQSTEEAARELRYAFLRETAQRESYDRIATAHNAGDNAETMLLNLIRGSGLKGVCGIPPVRGNIVRPILELSRSEIETYLETEGLEHVDDSSNATDDYSRNRLRHRVLPILAEISPSAVENMSRAAALLREDEEYLHSLAQTFVDKNREGNSIPIPALTELPPPVRNRVIRLMHGGSLGKNHVESIWRLCLVRSVHAYVDVPGMRVTREFQKLIFDEVRPGKTERRDLLFGERMEIPEAGYAIECEYPVKCEEIHKSLNTFFFKHESICGTMFVGSRAEGDKIALAGRKCTKTLKKLFSEAKLSLAERDTTPVIYDGLGPIAVYGFGVAERCKAAAGDEAVCVKIIKTEKGEDHGG